MLFESLENRSLPSASLAGGVLTITGTDNNDHIIVYHNSKTQIAVAELTIIPSATPHHMPTVSHHISKFNAADVKSIEVDAGKGNDFVDVGGSLRHPLALPATINGGDGNDYLAGGNG